MPTICSICNGFIHHNSFTSGNYQEDEPLHHAVNNAKFIELHCRSDAGAKAAKIIAAVVRVG